MKKTAVIMEVKWVSKNPNVPKRRAVIATLTMKNIMKKVIELEKGFDVQTDWYIPKSDIKKKYNIKSIVYH